MKSKAAHSCPLIMEPPASMRLFVSRFELDEKAIAHMWRDQTNKQNEKEERDEINRMDSLFYYYSLAD